MTNNSVDSETPSPESSPTSQPLTGASEGRSLATRHRIDRWFVRFCQLVAMLSVVILTVLLSSVLINGLPAMDWDFVTGSGSSDPNEAGIRPALLGSIWLCGVCGLFALPIGVATAIFLEEFKPHNKIAQYFHGFVQLNISNLAGVPSVVYGIIGLTAFAGMFGIFGTANDPAVEVGATYFDQFVSEGDRILLVPVDGPTADDAVATAGMMALDSSGQQVKVNVIGPRDSLPKDKAVRRLTLRSDAEAGRINNKAWYFFRLPMGRGVLAGGLTLMLVILPIVIIASQEALRAVPDSLREGSLGMGSTTWQTVQNVTLPASIPGIMTGSILAMSRAIGEAAPVLIICGIVYISSGPTHLMDDFSVMPLQIFNWTARPQHEFQTVAAKGILVLLALLLSFNTVAVLIRNKTQNSLS
ncbi:PstA family ABC transporter permease [Planctomycetes bacterium K23_9]|uniref:Phosphate transport system permease protein PstA n=1 Tax=Stieleria marina TaxID=1930275 RepID=A0A517NNA5_9BACT|nr:Phosphate transport system permease protein PstA [Planctomycetes bacterium K23_9]